MRSPACDCSWLSALGFLLEEAEVNTPLPWGRLEEVRSSLEYLCLQASESGEVGDRSIFSFLFIGIAKLKRDTATESRSLHRKKGHASCTTQSPHLKSGGRKKLLGNYYGRSDFMALGPQNTINKSHALFLASIRTHSNLELLPV